MDKKKKLIIEIIIFVLVLIAITFGYNYLINKLGEEESSEANLQKNDNENVEITEIKNMSEFEKKCLMKKKQYLLTSMQHGANHVK